MALLSQANYPNQFTTQELQQRLLVSIIPPALVFVGIKQRWTDLKVLIKRDKYSSLLVVTVIGGMSIALIAYLMVLLVTLINLQFGHLLYTLGYTILVFLPAWLSDYLIHRNNSQSTPVLDPSWEQATIRGEAKAAKHPPLFRLLRTPRRRFWIFLFICIVYGIILGRQFYYPPLVL